MSKMKHGNIISLIPEPAAFYMNFFAMFVSFFFLLVHSTGQQYDAQQLGGEEGGWMSSGQDDYTCQFQI